MEQLEQGTWFRLFCIISWYQGSKEPEPEESGFSTKKSESSVLLQLFCHFLYNENPIRALNTTCLLAINWCYWQAGKIHICILRLKVPTCKPALIGFTKKRSYFTNRPRTWGQNILFIIMYCHFLYSGGLFTVNLLQCMFFPLSYGGKNFK